MTALLAWNSLGKRFHLGLRAKDEIPIVRRLLPAVLEFSNIGIEGRTTDGLQAAYRTNALQVRLEEIEVLRLKMATFVITGESPPRPDAFSLVPERVLARIYLDIALQFRDLGLVKAVLLLKLNDHVLAMTALRARDNLSSLGRDDPEKWTAAQG